MAPHGVATGGATAVRNRMRVPETAPAPAARETALAAVALFAAFVAGAAAQEDSVASDRAALVALYDAT